MQMQNCTQVCIAAGLVRVRDRDAQGARQGQQSVREARLGTVGTWMPAPEVSPVAPASSAGFFGSAWRRESNSFCEEQNA